MKKQRQTIAPDTPASDEKQPVSGSSYTPPESLIGERIRKRRAEIGDGLSVEDLSRLCKMCDHEDQGVSRAALFRYESGKILPGARELRILCNAMKVSANWLLLGSESPDMPPVTSELAMALERWLRARANDNGLWEMVNGKPTGNDMVWHEQVRMAKNPPKS